MIRRNVPAIAVIFIFLCVSCSKQLPQQFDDELFINDAYNEWEKSFHAKDIEWWSSFVAPNAVFLPPDNPPLETIAAIRNYYEALFQDPHFSLDCSQTFVDVAESRDLAWSRGTCKATFAGPSGEVVSSSSKWTKVWVRLDDGKWKCRLNTWNYSEGG
jgi:ketosteroid isomerase-like protein